MQKAIDKVLVWGNSEQLTFNALKTKVIVFTHKTSIKTDEFSKLKLNNSELEFVKELKYLGVTLDSKLTWRSHIKGKVSECKRILMACRGMVSKNWGLSPERCLWLWESMVRPKLTYACLVWGQEKTLKPHIQALASLQRLAMLLICPSLRTTPTRGLEVILGLCPLHIKINEIAIKARVRTSDVVLNDWEETKRNKCAYKKYDHKDNHLNSLDKLIVKACGNFQSDKTHYKAEKINFTVLRKSRVENYSEKDIIIFTDGSKTKEGVGCGCLVTLGDHVIWESSYKLPNYSTVYQAEVFAINKAADWINNNFIEVPKCDIFINSDSQSCLNSLENSMVKSLTVKNCKLSLQKLGSDHNLTVQWIKGHDDATGNEAADALAKRGASKGTPCHVQEPVASINTKIEKAMELKWQEEWDKETTDPNNPRFKHTRFFIKKVSSNKLHRRKMIKMGRKKLRNVVAWVTGHCTLNKHLCTMQEQIGNLCRFCQEEEETPIHILFECERFERKRWETQSLANQHDEESPIMRTSRGIWAPATDQLTPALVNYINKCKEDIQARLDNDYVPG